jgi:hypothetical protein
MRERTFLPPRSAAALISVLAGACAPMAKLPVGPVASLSDTELLLAYGHSVRNSLTQKDRGDELDHEVQKRGLLRAAEVTFIEKGHLYEGMSAGAALASWGAPWKLGTSDRYPGLQVWHYTYDFTQSSQIFVSGGRIIGYKIAQAKHSFGSGPVKWTTQDNPNWMIQGQVFLRDDFFLRECSPPYSGKQAVVTNCTDLDIRPTTPDPIAAGAVGDNRRAGYRSEFDSRRGRRREAPGYR